MSSDGSVDSAREGAFWQHTTPLLYTSNPWKLLASDTGLFFKQAWSLPFIVWPFTPTKSGPLDELYPSWRNLFAIFVHAILTIAQVLFLLSIPIALIVPVPFQIVVVYIGGFLVINYYVCLMLLNGSHAQLMSSIDLSQFPSHDDEKWVFLNGVAVGQHWLQSNIDRISLSFRRPVLGVHNPTSGIVFDVLQCLIQRDFAYATLDIRIAYAAIKKFLIDPGNKKVVFILHSQGGIEGGLILDWLLADVPEAKLQKLEIYTFGNAANHFNNPHRRQHHGNEDNHRRQSRTEKFESGVFKHIEHYANGLDFVSRWGVLHFDSWLTTAGKSNRYRGRVFERKGGKGHQFCQHYMDNMFPLADPKHPVKGLREDNDFMDTLADVYKKGQDGIAIEGGETDGKSAERNTGNAELLKTRHGNLVTARKMDVVVWNLTLPPFGVYPERVSRLSRLWAYRNGRSPDGDVRG